MKINASTLTRRIAAGGAIVAMAASLLVAGSATAFDPCQGLQAATGVGSVTQGPAHSGVFIPAYNSLCPGGLISYQAVGDAAGVKGAISHDANYPFYATDVPLSQTESAFAEGDTSTLNMRVGSSINHVPIMVDGFAISYNLGACQTNGPLRLSGLTLSLIYSGAITKWNDPVIVRDNPGSPQLQSCGLSIKAAVRSDAAGPTLIFKDYLAKKNRAWLPFVQKDVNTVWPASLAVKCRGTGEAGMASCMSDSGAIGYIEYKVANSKGLRMAAIDNASGTFATPASDTVNVRWPDNCPAAASSSAVPPSTLSDWSETSLTNAPSGYALCSFSYILIYQQIPYAYTNAISAGRSINAVSYLKHALRDDVQAQLVTAGYAPLPGSIKAISRQGLDLVQTH